EEERRPRAKQPRAPPREPAPAPAPAPAPPRRRRARPSSPPPPAMTDQAPTYRGGIQTVSDALLVFEACRLGRLRRVGRRLSEKERGLVRSGAVFVWDETETGMRRWTDGRSWTASRISRSFLVYRELEGKPARCASSSGSASTSSSGSAGAGGGGGSGSGSGSGSAAFRAAQAEGRFRMGLGASTGPSPPASRSDTSEDAAARHDHESAASDPSCAASVTGRPIHSSPTPEMEPSRCPLSGSASPSVPAGDAAAPPSPFAVLTAPQARNVGKLKKGGLVKLSFSVTTVGGNKLHLIHYYTLDDRNSGVLVAPTDDPSLADIRIVREIYPEYAKGDLRSAACHLQARLPLHHHASHHRGADAPGASQTLRQRAHRTKIPRQIFSFPPLASRVPYSMPHGGATARVNGRRSAALSVVASGPEISAAPPAPSAGASSTSAAHAAYLHRSSPGHYPPVAPPPPPPPPPRHFAASLPMWTLLPARDARPHPLAESYVPPRRPPFPPYRCGKGGAVALGAEDAHGGLPAFQEIAWEKLPNSEDKRQIEAVYAMMKL
ncbi:MAG: Gti1/Pac2 family-domain-containing protein, partial [Olpidium bornovanus]